MPPGQHGMRCSRYIRKRTATGTGSCGGARKVLVIYFAVKKKKGGAISTKKPYVDKCHDPESVVHNGALSPQLSGRVALGYVVVSDGAVSEHASEMMNELSAVACVIPTACL